MFKHKMERSDSSHAILEANSRVRKARKIHSILGQVKDLSEVELLDIGTGSGDKAHELSKRVKSVTSVDLVDERKNKKGYRFQQVKDETLPFESELFDVVVTNHVVEHTPNQGKHIAEVRRVLKPGGFIYLATPNKFWLNDPHYKLPLISWMPRSVSERYLYLVQKAEWDIYPVSHFGIKKLLPHDDVTNALPLLLKTSAHETLDTMGNITRFLRLLPKQTLELTRYFSPTLIYLVKKSEE